MIEQDYIMRMIKEMVRAILKLAFGIETDSPSAELLENKEEREKLEELLDMAESGGIAEAQDRLLDMEGDSLMLELLFYYRLNEKSDEFLETRGFTREKIKLGIGQALARNGLGSVAELLDI